MIATLLLLILAINGGLFAGVILHSAIQIARFDQVVELYQTLWG
jgi:hypothetical protein